jgi:hypothetical protein
VISGCICITHDHKALFRQFCREAHFCFSNVRVLVGKPFQCQANVDPPLSTAMIIGTNHPTNDNEYTATRKKVLFDHIFSRHSHNHPPPKVVSTVLKEVKSLFHMCSHVCKREKLYMDDPHVDNQTKFTVMFTNTLDGHAMFENKA